MNQVSKSLTVEQVAAIEARNKAKADVVLPEFVAPVEQRTYTVKLEFPVTYNGETISEVTIRRPLMREWRNYLRDCKDAVDAEGPGADDYVDQPWVSIPAVVLENLDFNDASNVEAAQEGFFARSSLPPAAGQESQQTSKTGNQ